MGIAELEKMRFQVNLDSDIFQLQLSTKEERSLLKLGIMRVREFLELDLERVRDIVGYGSGTVLRLQKSRSRLVKLLEKTGTAEFSQIPQITSSRLRPAYTLHAELTENIDTQKEGATADLPSLQLTTKEMRALKRLGISSLQEFLDLNLERVRKIAGYGMGTILQLNNSRNRIARILNQTKGENSEILRPEQPIAELHLSARGIGTLHRLHIKTIVQYLGVDLKCIDDVRGCGNHTRLELLKTQQTLRASFGIESPRSIDKAVPPAIERQNCPWLELPLFSEMPRADISLYDLSAKCLPMTDLVFLDLPVRAKTAINDQNITLLGQLLLKTKSQIFGPGRNLRTTIKEMLFKVDEYLRYSSAESPQDIISPTADDFLLQLFEPLIRNTLQREILLARLGLGGNPPTLEQLGQKYLLTRERIRQIEEKCMLSLAHWRARNFLRPLNRVIVDILGNRSPFLSFRALSIEIQRRLKWPAPFNKATLWKLLSISPEYRIYDNNYICFDSFRCVDCPSLPKIIDAALANHPIKRGRLRSISRQLNDQMLEDLDCRVCDSRPNNPSMALFRRGFAEAKWARAHYRIIKNELWDAHEWK